MLTSNEFEFIKKTVFKTLEFNYNGEIQLVDNKGAYAKLENGKAYVGCENKTVLARGLMLLAKEISEGNLNFELHQAPNFETCGGMLDMSRNAVMRVDSVKEYLNTMACMGLNMLMLYTEDTYEVEGFPFFGYMRGRYSVKELQEIDDYAFNLGIEVIPCIQTLGHMEQYLRWQEALDIKDTPKVLLCGEEKSEKFIEAMIKTVRAAFRSKRIHIGMDEADDVGLGKYLHQNGYKNRFDILNEHLEVVLNLCKKYDFTPMMWSDMFFRLGSKTGDYYDLSSHIPQEKIDLIPDVDLVFWDYYHKDGNTYEKMIELHQKLNKNTIFAGGIWTWSGFLPDTEYSFKTMMPALKACCKYGIKEAFATMWGDNGAETNYFFSLPGLSIFSEFCYLGENCTRDDIINMWEFITKAEGNEVEALSDFHHTIAEEENMGKKLLYTDILYNFTGHIHSFDEYKSEYEKAHRILKSSNNKKWSDYYEYAVAIFEIIIIKCDVLSNLKNSYLLGNKDYLSNVSNEIIPDLIQKYEKLLEIHQKQWLKTNKVFGWETINARYGAVIARLKYAKEVLNNYVNGEIDSIEELEFELLEEPIKKYGNFTGMISTSLIY